MSALDEVLREWGGPAHVRDSATSELWALRDENVKLHDEKWLVAKPGYTYLPSKELDELRTEVERLRRPWWKRIFGG